MSSHFSAWGNHCPSAIVPTIGRDHKKAQQSGNCVCENKSRALSITRYGAAYQRNRWARGCAEWREQGSDKKIERDVEFFSSRTADRDEHALDVQRRTLYLRAFKFWPIRIHFERGQAVIYAYEGLRFSAPARRSNPRVGETRGRNGSFGVTERGIEREIKRSIVNKRERERR